VEGPAQQPSPEAAAAAAAAETAAREARERDERERAALKADLDALRAQLAAEQSARQAAEAAVAAQVEALSTKVKEEPPTVSTARLGLGLTGFMQNDLVFRQSSQDQLNASGVPLNEDRFLIRRARLKATIDRWWVAGALEFDGNTVNGPTARVLDAEASLKWPPERGAMPLLMGTIGAFKIPFGFEIGQSDRERLFMERSNAERAMFPGEYDAGARLMGGWRFVRYVVAIMNGEPVGEKGGFPFRDPNQAKDVVGRVGVDTPVAPTVWVAGGFSGLTGKGFHPGTPAAKATLQWTDRNLDGQLSGLNEIAVTPATAATPSQNFTRFAYGGDLRVGVQVPVLGEAIAYGEFYWAKNLDRALVPADPISFGRDYREIGYYAALTQELGPHAMAGVRYDWYNPDADSVNQVMGALVPTALAFSTWSITAALRGTSGRLIAEIDINRNHNGRDLLGNPVNLKDNAFTLRGEVSF
jgi:hypothetical protein